MFLILVLYALCASTFTISKALLFYCSPFFSVGVRMISAGLLLLGFCWWQQMNFTIRRKDFFHFATIILCHVYISYMADLWALQYMTSVKSAFLYNIAPFFSAIFSYFYFSERMTARKWLGMAVGFVGFLPELIAKAPTEGAGVWFLSWPEIVTFIAVIAGVIGWVAMRQLVKDGHYSPFFVNGFGMWWGGILALATSLFVEQWWVISPVSDVWQFVKFTVLIVLVSNVLFYNLYGYLLKKYTATFISFAGFLSPLFAVVFGWIFLCEHVSWYFFLSLFVVAIGLYIFYQEELRQGYVK